MIKLWNHNLLDARAMNNCNIILQSYQEECSDRKQSWLHCLVVLRAGPVGNKCCTLCWSFIFLPTLSFFLQMVGVRISFICIPASSLHLYLPGWIFILIRGYCFCRVCRDWHLSQVFCWKWMVKPETRPADKWVIPWLVGVFPVSLVWSNKTDGSDKRAALKFLAHSIEDDNYNLRLSD